MKNLLINSLCLQLIKHNLSNLAVGIYENNIAVALVIVVTHTHRLPISSNLVAFGI